MPPDGTTSASENPENGRPPLHPESGRGRGRNTKRFRRFLRIGLALTLASHLTVALALSAFVPVVWAVVLTAVLTALTTWRLVSLVRGSRRPRPVSEGVDAPLLAHWSGAMLSTLTLPVWVVTTFAVSTLTGGADGLGRVLQLAAVTGYVMSLGLALWGTFVRRRWVRVVHVEVPVHGLPPELDGYRIAQVTDLHIGNFDPKATGLRWAERVNSLDADLVAVTGDLVTTGTEFYPDVAEVIGAMRGKDGTWVVLGNHDQWAPDELTRLLRERGARVLRNQSECVQRGGARLRIAGIDDPMTDRANLDVTLADQEPDVPTVLLSHYPDFFEAAAKRGVALVLSGHTHGGQVAVPFQARRFSLSTLARQHAYGVHVRDKTRLYVNAGLGTTGPPMRVGIPPEIAVLVLRCP